MRDALYDVEVVHLPPVLGYVLEQFDGAQQISLLIRDRGGAEQQVTAQVLAARR